jgi:hypothetical protein
MEIASRDQKKGPRVVSLVRRLGWSPRKRPPPPLPCPPSLTAVGLHRRPKAAGGRRRRDLSPSSSGSSRWWRDEVGSDGLLLIFFPGGGCGVGGGWASCGWAAGGGGSLRPRPLPAAGCAAPRRASPPAVVAVRVGACLKVREVDPGGGARPD